MEEHVDPAGQERLDRALGRLYAAAEELGREEMEAAERGDEAVIEKLARLPEGERNRIFAVLGAAYEKAANKVGEWVAAHPSEETPPAPLDASEPQYEARAEAVAQVVDIALTAREKRLGQLGGETAETEPPVKRCPGCGDALTPDNYYGKYPHLCKSCDNKARVRRLGYEPQQPKQKEVRMPRTNVGRENINLVFDRLGTVARGNELVKSTGASSFSKLIQAFIWADEETVLTEGGNEITTALVPHRNGHLPAEEEMASGVGAGQEGDSEWVDAPRDDWVDAPRRVGNLERGVPRSAYAITLTGKSGFGFSPNACQVLGDWVQIQWNAVRRQIRFVRVEGARDAGLHYHIYTSKTGGSQYRYSSDAVRAMAMLKGWGIDVESNTGCYEASHSGATLTISLRN